MENMIRRFTIYAFCLLFISLFCLPAGAYDNDGPERNILGGPHRAINKWALSIYLDREDTELQKFLAHYDFDGNELKGTTVIEPGMESIKEGDKTGTPDWWIVEGGYTADEPELYNSFRHFYDPKNEKIPYLTDHLDQLEYVYKFSLFVITDIPYLSFIPDVNPRVDARDWAINGTQNNGVAPNEYCWNKGLQYMNEAFTCTDQLKRDRLFAKAWRSLGETMHLMADMTCVPHVRNDSHPGKPLNVKLDSNLGLVKNDPYELLVTEEMIDAIISGTEDNNGKLNIVVDREIKDKIDAKTSCDMPGIFDNVACYTNENFFSADTVSGNYEGLKIHNANGMPDYDSPKLENCKPDKEGYFIRNINGKDIRLAHISWFGKSGLYGLVRDTLGMEGWGAAEKSTIITGACVQDQASILIPVAVYANAKLIDWFVPRVEVKITDVNVETKELKGTITHIPYGAYKTPMLFNGDENQCELYIDGGYRVRGDEYKAKIQNGEITLIMKGDTKEIPLEGAKTVQLNILMGGIRVSSDDFAIDGSVSTGKWILTEAYKDEVSRNGESEYGEELKQIPVDVNDINTCSFNRGGNASLSYADCYYEYKISWEGLPSTMIPGQIYTINVTCSYMFDLSKFPKDLLPLIYSINIWPEADQPFDTIDIMGEEERSEERRVGKECRSRWSPYH